MYTKHSQTHVHTQTTNLRGVTSERDHNLQIKAKKKLPSLLCEYLFVFANVFPGKESILSSVAERCFYSLPAAGNQACSILEFPV